MALSVLQQTPASFKADANYCRLQILENCKFLYPDQPLRVVTSTDGEDTKILLLNSKTNQTVPYWNTSDNAGAPGTTWEEVLMTTENAVASKLVKLGARNIEEGLVQVQTSAELEAKLRKSEEECKAATEGAARLLEAAREREGENQDLRQMLQKVQAEKELWQSRYQQARPKASAEHSCECQPQDPIVVPAASPHISAMKRQLHHLESTNSELLAQKQDLSTKLTASANREAGLARMIADAAATQAQLDEQCEVTAALVEENQRLYASLQSHEDSEAALLRRLQAAEAPTPPRRTHTNGATTPRASHATAFSALGIIAAPPYPDSDSEVDWWSGASPGPHSDSVQAGRRPSFMPSPQQSGVVHESLWGPGPAAQLDMDTYQGPGAPAGFAQPRRAQTVPWY